MILKIIFNINFVDLLHRGGKGKLDLGRADNPLSVPAAPQTRIEGSTQGVSQEMKAKHSDVNSAAREEDEPR
jgi:hypothetical protein